MNNQELKTFINKNTTEKKYILKEKEKSYKMFLEDSDKANRIIDNQCKVCYYNSRIGGARITHSNCDLCQDRVLYASTNVDKICKFCAVEHNLCKHCGSDINLKERRK